MTQHLETLKGILQKALTEPNDSEDYKDAISNAIYSCQFETTTALEQWLSIWTLTDHHLLTEDEIEYQEGVQFVAEQWDRVLSEDNEGEGL